MQCDKKNMRDTKWLMKTIKEAGCGCGVCGPSMAPPKSLTTRQDEHFPL